VACRTWFSTGLAENGYETFVAASGPEAVALVRHRCVHAAVLDMHMPGMTGLETLAAIRIESRQRIPAILVSDDASKELRLKALAARFDVFLSKPVNLAVLRDAIGCILERQGRRWGRFQAPGGPAAPPSC
jgi:two-component system chemotaxis response regulator CheY